MTVQDELRNSLGVNQKALTGKSAQFSRFLIDRLVGNTNPTQADMLQHVSDNFTAGKLTYYAIILMLEKTDQILESMANDNDPNIQAIGLFAKTQKANFVNKSTNNN